MASSPCAPFPAATPRRDVRIRKGPSATRFYGSYRHQHRVPCIQDEPPHSRSVHQYQYPSRRMRSHGATAYRADCGQQRLDIEVRPAQLVLRPGLPDPSLRTDTIFVGRVSPQRYPRCLSGRWDHDDVLVLDRIFLRAAQSVCRLPELTLIARFDSCTGYLSFLMFVAQWFPYPLSRFLDIQTRYVICHQVDCKLRRWLSSGKFGERF